MHVQSHFTPAIGNVKLSQVHSLGERVRHFCSKNHIRLDKQLGQHFLIDENVLNTIIESANIKPFDHIVEIGPGIGILTAELLKKAEHVTAIEVDAKLITISKNYLNLNLQTCKLDNLLTLIHGNALKAPFPREPYKIVANIPYHITSPLLRHAFLESQTPPVSLTLMIQKEVAQKICDEKSPGLLTILTNLFGKPKITAFAPPESFLPPPEVHSAVLHIECFGDPKADKQTIDEIFRLAKIAFSQKRKMLRNTIGMLPHGGELLSSLGIEEKRRPQELSIEEWIALAEKFAEDTVRDSES